MLTVEQNEELTRVGPGTPMGELLRRYWYPIAFEQDFDGVRGHAERHRDPRHHHVLPGDNNCRHLLVTCVRVRDLAESVPQAIYIIPMYLSNYRNF